LSADGRSRNFSRPQAATGALLVSLGAAVVVDAIGTSQGWWTLKCREADSESGSFWAGRSIGRLPRPPPLALERKRVLWMLRSFLGRAELYRVPRSPFRLKIPHATEHARVFTPQHGKHIFASVRSGFSPDGFDMKAREAIVVASDAPPTARLSAVAQ
jgi:hypothetical protein